MLYYLGTQERATKYRGVEQMVARRAHNPEVAGSSPVPATTKSTLKRRFQRAFSFCLFAKMQVCPWVVRSGGNCFEFHGWPAGAGRLLEPRYTTHLKWM